MKRRPPCRQSGEFDPETGRPLCQHGESMIVSGRSWLCKVAKRERDHRYSPRRKRVMTPEQLDTQRRRWREQKRNLTPAQRDRVRVQDKERKRRYAQTPGTYEYNRVRGIGIPGMHARFKANRYRRKKTKSTILQQIHQLVEEAKSLE